MGIKEKLAKGAGKLRKVGSVIAGDRGIYSKLKEEHAEVFALMKQAQRGDETARSELFPKIRRELLSHARAEDKVFYSILDQHGETKERTSLNRQEHEQMETLVSRLSTLPVNSGEWRKALDELVEVVETHVRSEENELFPRAKRVIDDKRARELERRFIEARQREMEKLEAPVGAPMPGQKPPEQEPPEQHPTP